MVNPVILLGNLLEEKYNLIYLSIFGRDVWYKSFGFETIDSPGMYVRVILFHKKDFCKILINKGVAFQCKREELPTQMYQIEKILDGILL